MKKSQLEIAFLSIGFQNVRTFRQSGNIVFETDIEGEDALEAIIESKLKGDLGFEIVVFLRTIPELRSIIDQRPFDGQQEDGTSFLITFLRNEPTRLPFPVPIVIPKSTALIISSNGRELYSVTHGGGEGSLPNQFIEAKMKVKATTRNLRTVIEIVEAGRHFNMG